MAAWVMLLRPLRLAHRCSGSRARNPAPASPSRVPRTRTPRRHASATHATPTRALRVRWAAIPSPNGAATQPCQARYRSGAEKKLLVQGFGSWPARARWAWSNSVPSSASITVGKRARATRRARAPTPTIQHPATTAGRRSDRRARCHHGSPDRSPRPAAPSATSAARPANQLPVTSQVPCSAGRPSMATIPYAEHATATSRAATEARGRVTARPGTRSSRPAGAPPRRWPPTTRHPRAPARRARADR